MKFPVWDKLPLEMKNEYVKEYCDILKKRRSSLILKRGFDIVASFLLLIILALPFVIIACAVYVDDPGPVFYRQERVTQFGRHYRIHKFRSMRINADKTGALVTVKGDPRITRVGGLLRRFRLDELCQLIDVLVGNMTFVGTRPEVKKYVAAYSDEMKATLLLPAGITSLASIYFKDEDAILEGAEDVSARYIEEVLPRKMHYNLTALRDFGFFKDIKIMFMTFFAMLGREYHDSEAEGDIYSENADEALGAVSADRK